MNEFLQLEHTISEYRRLFERNKVKQNGKLDAERLASRLSREHEWTRQGAETLIYLANEYGAFMLRNALALAIVIGKEDGNLGF